MGQTWGGIKQFGPKGKNATLVNQKFLAYNAFTVDLLAGEMPWRTIYLPDRQRKGSTHHLSMDQGLLTGNTEAIIPCHEDRTNSVAGITTIMVIYWQLIPATDTPELLSKMQWCLAMCLAQTCTNTQSLWTLGPDCNLSHPWGPQGRSGGGHQ